MCKKSMKLVRSRPSITQVGKTLSSGFISKIILPRVEIQMHSLEIYKLQTFYYAQKVYMYIDEVFGT